MTFARLRFDAALAILKRDARIFMSYRGRFFGQVFSGFFSVAVFFYVSRLVSTESFHSSNQYFAFVVVGLATFGILTSTLVSLPSDIRQELVAGTFERILLSPFGAVWAIVSMTIFPFVMALTGGLVTLMLARLAFGMPIEWQTAWLGIPVVFLGALTFVPFGLLAASAAVSAKQATMGVSLIVTGVSFLGGVFFPVALLPGWIQWTSKVQPFTPTLDMLRHLLVGTPLHGSAFAALAKMVLFAVCLLPPAIAALHVAVRVGQRRGTIIEY
jgi:ABC-2 type transport system permease protein